MADGELDDDPIRFADVLTTGSAVANYLGSPVVIASHLVHAIDILTGAKTLEDLGRAISPLVRRVPAGMGSGVDPAVRELAQRWFARMGSDHAASMGDEDLAELRAELDSLANSSEASAL